MKTWEKPQLVVLTRSEPEEAVLGWCKEVGAYPFGPMAGYIAFSCIDVTAYDCAECSAYAPS